MNGSFEALVTRWVINPLVPHVPQWVSPNSLTLLNHGLLWLQLGLCCHLAWNDEPSLRLVVALCLLASIVLDGLDGAHARRTNQCSPLGEILDHGLDGLNGLLTVAGLWLSWHLLEADQCLSWTRGSGVLKASSSALEKSWVFNELGTPTQCSGFYQEEETAAIPTRSWFQLASAWAFCGSAVVFHAQLLLKRQAGPSAQLTPPVIDGSQGQFVVALAHLASAVVQWAGGPVCWSAQQGVWLVVWATALVELVCAGTFWRRLTLLSWCEHTLMLAPLPLWLGEQQPLEAFVAFFTPFASLLLALHVVVEVTRTALKAELGLTSGSRPLLPHGWLWLWLWLGALALMLHAHSWFYQRATLTSGLPLC